LGGDRRWLTGLDLAAGCGSAIASSSYMTERVKGLTLEQAGAIKNTEIAKELCLPPVKLHCSSKVELSSLACRHSASALTPPPPLSVLAEDAITAAIKVRPGIFSKCCSGRC
jgi:NifU-like protein involved in Fe-S cluster formation